jgi:hypothetical protein
VVPSGRVLRMAVKDIIWMVYFGRKRSLQVRCEILYIKALSKFC